MPTIELTREITERTVKVSHLGHGVTFRDPREPGVVYMTMKPLNDNGLTHAVRLTGSGPGTPAMFTNHDYHVIEVRATLTTKDV